MRYVEVADARMSAVGLGTWQFGSAEWGYGDAYAEHTAVEITRRALDLGVNLIDTAEIYAMGRSERIVGRAITGRRAEAFVATKIFPVLPLASVVEQRGRASAARLGIETIDLYQVHWPNPVVPLARTMAGMRRLREASVINHVGVSNFSLKRWKAAERALGGPVLTNQVSYSLVNRKPERELIPWAQASDRLVIAYSPLAQGFLSGRYDGSGPPPDGLRAMNGLFLPENIERARPLFAALWEIAAGHGATPAQIALAWVLRRPNVVAIAGASRVEQVEANVAAADLALTDDEDHRLTTASDDFHPLTGPMVKGRLLKARLTTSPSPSPPSRRAA